MRCVDLCVPSAKPSTRTTPAPSSSLVAGHMRWGIDLSTVTAIQSHMHRNNRATCTTRSSRNLYAFTRETWLGAIASKQPRSYWQPLSTIQHEYSAGKPRHGALTGSNLPTKTHGATPRPQLARHRRSIHAGQVHQGRQLHHPQARQSGNRQPYSVLLAY